VIQVIVYSIATGRVRRAVDPTVMVPNAISYMNQVAIVPGEGRLVYNKQGSGLDTLAAWQATVNAHTGLNPEGNQTDWCCGVDVLFNILRWGRMDPVCDPPTVGETIIPAPWGSDNRWTYDGVTFTPPVLVKPLA